MWNFLTAFTCFYGFIKELKIGEPFIYLYQNEVLNLTREQITNEAGIIVLQFHWEFHLFKSFNLISESVNWIDQLVASTNR